MRAVCIDFETANGFIGSACSVGIAVLEEGQIVDTHYWLIKPHPRYSYFDPLNVSIHGIKAQDVKNAPEFDLIYGQISPLFENAYVIAHNASFDMSVLRHVLDLYEIPYPELELSGDQVNKQSSFSTVFPQSCFISSFSIRVSTSAGSTKRSVEGL